MERNSKEMRQMMSDSKCMAKINAKKHRSNHSKFDSIYAERKFEESDPIYTISARGDDEFDELATPRSTLTFINEILNTGGKNITKFDGPVTLPIENARLLTYNPEKDSMYNDWLPQGENYNQHLLNSCLTQSDGLSETSFNLPRDCVKLIRIHQRDENIIPTSESIVEELDDNSYNGNTQENSSMHARFDGTAFNSRNTTHDKNIEIKLLSALEHLKYELKNATENCVRIEQLSNEFFSKSTFPNEPQNMPVTQFNDDLRCICAVILTKGDSISEFCNYLHDAKYSTVNEDPIYCDNGDRSLLAIS